MQPFHKSIISTMSSVTIIAGNELLAVGGLAFAASLMATTTIPGEPNDIFEAFGAKFDEISKIDKPDILVALAENVGGTIKEHIGDMDLPTATFFKAKLDGLRDQVAHLAPGDMHKIEHAVFAVRELADRITVLTPPADDADLAVDKLADRQSGTGQQSAGTEQAQA